MKNSTPAPIKTLPPKSLTFGGSFSLQYTTIATTSTLSKRCLCPPHNFCIDQMDQEFSNPIPKNIAFKRREGGFGLRLEAMDVGVNWGFDNKLDRVDALLDGGDHWEDTTRGKRRRYQSQMQLPVNPMLQYIDKMNFERPAMSAYNNWISIRNIHCARASCSLHCFLLFFCIGSISCAFVVIVVSN